MERPAVGAGAAPARALTEPGPALLTLPGARMRRRRRAQCFRRPGRKAAAAGPSAFGARAGKLAGGGGAERPPLPSFRSTHNPHLGARMHAHPVAPFPRPLRSPHTHQLTSRCSNASVPAAPAPAVEEDQPAAQAVRGVEEAGRQRNSGPRSIGAAPGPASALPTAPAPAAALGAAERAPEPDFFFFFGGASHGRGASVRCKRKKKKQNSQPPTRLRVGFLCEADMFITRSVKSGS